MGKRRREDLAVARRLGEEFALGDVRGVTRSRAARPFRTRFLVLGNATAIPGLIGYALFAAVVIAGSVVTLTADTARVLLVLISVAGVLLIGHYAGQFMLRHAFAPGTDADRVFWFAAGLARLTTADPRPCVLRWDGVETVTAEIISDDNGGWYYTCTLRDAAGTGITLGFCDDATVGDAPKLARDLLSETARLLAPRIVPPLIQAYESGQPVTSGGWTVDRTGISGGASGYVTDCCPWAETRRISMERQPAKAGPATQIGVYRDGKRPALEIDLSEVPNGIFLPSLVAYAAAGNGVEVRGGAGPGAGPLAGPF